MNARNVLIASSGVVVTAAVLALTPTGRAAAAKASQIVEVAFTDGSGNSVGNTVQLAPGATVTASPASGATFPVSGSVNVTNSSLAVTGSVAVDDSQSTAQSSTFGGAAKNALVTVNANDGRQPFFLEMQMQQTSCTNCVVGQQTLSLGGKQLVIEYISGRIFGSAPAMLVQFSATNAQFDPTISAYLSPVVAGAGIVSTEQFVYVNQQLRAYARDGDHLRAEAIMASNGFIQGSLEIHGYLIDP